MNVLKAANSTGLRTGNRFRGATARVPAFVAAILNPIKRLASARPLASIILLNLILLGSGSWLLPLVDRDEPRFAEASREMLERHDWAVPWFNGQYRFDKPPLIYWCQMLSFRLMGESAFAARLPGIIFSAATAGLLFCWGRRLGGDELGRRAAIYFSTCAGLLVYGRLAFADMPMIFFGTAAVWSGWELTRLDAEPNTFWWAVVCLSLGLGFLAKGPVAWLPLVGLSAARLLRADDYASRSRQIWWALLAAAGIVACWGVPALMATRGEYLKVGLGHHVIFRSVHVLDGHGGSSAWSWALSALFFIPVLIAGFFPWCFLFPRALRRWWQERSRPDGLGNYLLIQSLVVLGVFTFVRTKLPHYILPAFPCIALWLARETFGEPVSILVRRTSKWALGMTIVTMLITSGGFLLARPTFIASSLFQQSRPWLKPEMRFATVDYAEPSLVWEFRSILTNHLQTLTLQEARQFIARKGPLVLLVPGNFPPGEWTGNLTNGCKTVHAGGFDLPHGKRMEISALVRTQ